MLFNLFLNYIFQQTIQKIRGKKDYSRKCVKNGKNEKKKKRIKNKKTNFVLSTTWPNKKRRIKNKNKKC